MVERFGFDVQFSLSVPLNWWDALSAIAQSKSRSFHAGVPVHFCDCQFFAQVYRYTFRVYRYTLPTANFLARCTGTHLRCTSTLCPLVLF